MFVQVNNAGCMVNKREVTDDGIEKNFATNTLGIIFLYSYRNSRASSFLPVPLYVTQSISLWQKN